MDHQHPLWTFFMGFCTFNHMTVKRRQENTGRMWGEWNRDMTQARLKPASHSATAFLTIHKTSKWLE